MRKVATEKANHDGGIGEVERVRQLIPEDSWDAEFMKVTGLDVQMITNSLKLISHRFGEVSAKGRVENIEGELIMFVDIATPLEKREEFDGILSSTLKDLDTYFPTVSPHVALGLKHVQS